LIAALDEVDAHVILAEDGPVVAQLIRAGASVEVLPLLERTRGLRKDRVGVGLAFPISVADVGVYVVRLARRLRALDPDIVHTNTLKAGIYGSLAARVASVPVVWHVRDRIASDYLSRPAVALLRFLVAVLPNGVAVNSEATGQTLWRRPRRYALVRDPVERHDPPGDGEPGEPFTVGMVGRIAPWKGQHVFIQAFARAFAGGTERAAIVGAAMFGGTEERYGTELREMSAALSIADRVEFRGFREDVWAELARMDLFVHASVTTEPFGQVIVEAMHAGVPVIASAGGGPSEIVTNGVDGLLYPPGDIDALVEALRRLRDDAPLRRQLAGNARHRAEQFSPRASASSLMALYAQVLGRTTTIVTP
jgi:glycosyltransferase involved in cell wall biosynthesis